MQEINVSELKAHPRNNEFFDDITGEKWSEFLDSVKSRGVIEPIVITPDKTIVSGHQRVRACKELGIDKVMCDVHTYDNEDQILQDLLETNIRQRGDVGGSAQKVGKRIKELERIYGIKQGGCRYYGNQYQVVSNNFKSPQKTQEELASEIGITVRTLENYKQLADMIPELSDLVDTGIVTKTTALAIMRELPEDEQAELISQMDTTKKITQREVEKYIEAYNDLKANPPVPKDYEATKRSLANCESDYAQLSQDFQNKTQELQEVRKQMEKMKVDKPVAQYSKKLKDSVSLFCSMVNTFIEDVGGYIWLTDEINNIPDLEREGYIRAVDAVKSWADQMEYNINNNTKEIWFQNIQNNVGTLNDRTDQVELREEITTEQKESIRSACRKRINEILGDDPDIYARYYQTFAQSLWKDMRKNCGMGSRLEETHKRDYQRILDGIEAWRPACGIQTLKERKDTNAKARAEAREKGYL